MDHKPIRFEDVKSDDLVAVEMVLRGVLGLDAPSRMVDLAETMDNAAVADRKIQFQLGRYSVYDAVRREIVSRDRRAGHDRRVPKSDG